MAKSQQQSKSAKAPVKAKSPDAIESQVEQEAQVPPAPEADSSPEDQQTAPQIDAEGQDTPSEPEAADEGAPQSGPSDPGSEAPEVVATTDSDPHDEGGIDVGLMTDFGQFQAAPGASEAEAQAFTADMAAMAYEPAPILEPEPIYEPMPIVPPVDEPAPLPEPESPMPILGVMGVLEPGEQVTGERFDEGRLAWITTTSYGRKYALYADRVELLQGVPVKQAE